MIDGINKQLKARGLNIAVEAIHYYTEGRGRPSDRIHQQPFRWVPGDARREAQGDDITHLIATNRGATLSGVSANDTKAAIQLALGVWKTDKALKKVDLVERQYQAGTDVTIFDEFFAGFDDFPDPEAPGNFLVADIVNAGWLPRAFFEAAGGPGGGRGILAFSVTFIWQNDDGTPSDVNGDNRLDTALNEVYYNNTFGDPNAPDNRNERPWGVNAAPPGIDIETVALHENGHSLGLGHFGPPPSAVMNPIYDGIKHAPLSPDRAGMHTVWASWPNP